MRMKNLLIVTACLLFAMQSCKNQPAGSNANSNTKNLKTEEILQKHPNGVMKMKGKMVGGKREGLWQSFFENCLKQSETTYYAGERNGEHIVWYDNGMMYFRGRFQSDKKWGIWQYYDNEGKLHYKADYNKNPPVFDTIIK